MSGSSGLGVRAHSSVRTPPTPHPDEGNILLRLLEDSAKDLLQLLEANMPLTPALHTLCEHMIMQDYSSRGEVTHAAHPWALMESSAYEILSALCYAHLPVLFYAQPSTFPGQSTNCALSSVTDLHRLPTPAPSPTPNSLRSSSCSLTSVSVDLATTREAPSMLPALGRRSRSHGEVTHGPSPPAKKRCRLAAFAGADQTGMFAPGDPPDPGFGPDGPHFINDECNRGARRLRVRVTRAAALGYDPLEEGEEEEQEQEQEEGREEQEEGQEEQEEGREEQEEDAHSDAGGQPLGGSADARRGAWRQRPLDDPKISCSDQAAAIIAELASAHCLSSIHNPLRWLRDIGDHLLDPSMVDDDSLLSIISRCKRMMEKDIRTNFMVMINFMTLVCKSQRCVFFGLFIPHLLNGTY